jgi:hypothetical protein
MVQIIKKIGLEVSKPNLIQAIVAKQYDNNSRFLQVTLMHEGNKIEIAPTSTVIINAKRNDGEEKPFAGEANDDGTATVPLTYWMLELEGEVWCDVSVIDTEGRKLTSTKFDLLVERASCNSGDITEDENYDVLVKLIEDVNKVKPDTEMSDTSENPVQNKVIKAYIDNKTRKTEDLFFYNFYNISTNTSGIVITNEGKELSNSTYSTTDYTLLEKGTYYVTGFNKLTEKNIEQKFKYLIRYDLNKSFVSRTDFTSGSFEITTDCYVRFSGTPNNMNFIVISKDYAPTEYVGYGVKLKLEHLPIDTKVSESNNPVSSGAVKEYVDNAIEKTPTSEITVDDEMSDESTNPVQNKVIKEYVDKKTMQKINIAEFDYFTYPIWTWESGIYQVYGDGTNVDLESSGKYYASDGMIIIADVPFMEWKAIYSFCFNANDIEQNIIALIVDSDGVIQDGSSAGKFINERIMALESAIAELALMGE